MTLTVGGAPISLSRVTNQLTPIEEKTGVLIEGANHRDIIPAFAVGSPRPPAQRCDAPTSCLVLPCLHYDSTRTPEHAFAVRRTRGSIRYNVLVDLTLDIIVER